MSLVICLIQEPLLDSDDFTDAKKASYVEAAGGPFVNFSCSFLPLNNICNVSTLFDYLL